MDGDGNFAAGVSVAYTSPGFKCTRHLEVEVALYRRARLLRVMVEENACGRQSAALAGCEEVPDLAQGKPHAEATAPGETSHRSQFAGVNSPSVDGDRHWSIVNQNRDRVTKAAAA